MNSLSKSLDSHLFRLLLTKSRLHTAMNDQVEEGKAKAAGIVGILIGVIALIELICGFIYLSKGGPEGSGLWSGVGVNNCQFCTNNFFRYLPLVL